MVEKFNNINSIKDNCGHTIIKLYDCNGQLVWEKNANNWVLIENDWIIGDDGKLYEKYYDANKMHDFTPTIDLNGEWVEDTVSGNLNIDENYAYYMSNSNYNVDDSYAQFKVTWSGMTNIKFLYRSYGESNYDYLVINGLDKPQFATTPSDSTSGILAHTKGKQTTTYQELSIDCDEGEHFIWFAYRKDSSFNSNSDRAFVGIPKLKEYEGEYKKGSELRYEYVASSEYVLLEDGLHIRYKKYKTYYSPNNEKSYKTDEYILGEAEEAAIITRNYLRFNATTNDVHIGVINLEKFQNLKYSKGLEDKWTDFTTDGVDLLQGETLYLKGTGKTFSTSDYGTIMAYDLVECHGDCRSILSSDFENLNKMTAGVFQDLFLNSKITTAPELPATTLSVSSYHSMFSGCTSLVNAPELPATTLMDYCYYEMFSGCTSLVNAPELPATTLTNGCYYRMFKNCTSLVNAPELPATTLADSCYYEMFSNCKDLIPPELPATKLASFSYDGMFSVDSEYGSQNNKILKCNIMYNKNGTKITNSIGTFWLKGWGSGCIFYKNPNWSGPTTRGNDTIPADVEIRDWVA